MSCHCEAVDGAGDGVGGELQAFFAGKALPRAWMKDEVLGAKREARSTSPRKPANSSREYRWTGCKIDQIAGVDDEGPTSSLARSSRIRSACWDRPGRAPHARARGKNLKSVGADFARAFNGVGRPACRAQVHADSWPWEQCTGCLASPDAALRNAAALSIDAEKSLLTELVL